MSGCSRHPSKEATGACINCGKLVCAICDVELGGKTYCQPCADKLFAVKAAAAQETKPAVTEPSKPVLPDSTKSVNTELEDKDKTVIVASTSAAAAAVGKKPKEQPAKVGWVWWIPPAILGWIGGLLSWFANKDSEPKTARNMLFGGIGMSALHLLLAFIIVVAAVMPGAQIPVVKLQSIAPTEINASAKTTLTEKATAAKGATIQAAGISMKVPPGAVKSDTQIVVKEFADLPADFYTAQTDEPPEMALAMGNAYDVGPAGVQFDKPAQVTINYDKTLLPNGAKPENIKVGYWDGKNWIVENGYVDVQKGTVTISAANFPGSLVVPLLVGGAIITAVAYKLSKLLSSDPRNQGTASKHIMPDNDTVKSFTGKAGVGSNAKQWVPLVDPQRPGKLNPKIVSGSGYKQIGFMEKGDKSPTRVEYQEMVDGSDVNWTPPDAFLKNKGKGGSPKGDCTCVTNTVVSMLRGLGIEAYGVDGEANPNGKWREHAWVEFVYEGKPYYYDNDNGVVPLEDMKGKISVPKYTFNRGYMWNENGQKSYQVGWWKGKSSAPTVTIASPGRTGYINKSYKFVAKPDNIPTGARIEWYISGGLGESTAVYRDNETVSHEFKSEGEKAVKAQYMQGNTIVTSDNIIFVIQGSSSLDVELPPPSSTEGKPLDPDKPNTFTAIPKNVPPDAVYTWYISGTKMDEGKDKTTLTVPAKSLQPVAEYEVSVIANWTGEDRKNKWLKASKAFFVETKSLYIVSDLPKKQAGKVCTEYTFTAKSGDMQPGTSFEWTVDGEQAGSGTDSISHMFRNHGSLLVTVKATWQSEGNAKSNEAKYDVQIAEPKIVLKGPKELEQGEMGTLYEYYTFSIDPENIPDGAIFKMGGIAVTGTEEQFKMLDTGKQTVTAEASWDINGCSGKVSDAREFEVGDPVLDQIVATPAIGKAGQQTTFKASGKYIPKSVSIQWELGKDEGSQNTSSMDEEVKHTYATAGSYAVTATVRGSGQALYGVKVLFYTVDAKSSLTLSMPPAGTADDKYTFTANPTGIPPGAVYTWSINGTQVIAENDKTTLTTPANYFKAGITYKFYVVATWIDKTTPGVARANATFELPDNATLNIIPPPDIEMKTAKENTKYYFTFDNKGIPDAATFTWYSDGKEAGKGQSTGIAFAAGPHTVELKANWQSSDAAKTPRELRAPPLNFNIAGAPAKVTIIPPPDIAAGKGVTGVRYAFVASPENVPKGAMYAWYLNGQPATGGIDDMQAIAEPDFFKIGSYTLALNITWADPALGNQRVTNTISFQIKSGTVTPPVTPTLSIMCSSTASGLIVNTEYIFTANMANATPTGAYTWNVGNGSPNGPLNTASVKCKFATAGTYTITLRATGKTAAGNQELSAQLPVTVHANTEISKEEVSFIVFRWVTTKWSDGSTTKARQYCQQFHIQILRDNIVIDSGDSIARNGAFEIVLPTGHYTYKVGGKYLNPDGVCAGASGFDVIKGGRNIVEIEDSPLTKSP
jgi:hypothetical protein